VAARIFSPRLERLESREAPAVLGGPVTVLSSVSVVSVLEVSVTTSLPAPSSHDSAANKHDSKATNDHGAHPQKALESVSTEVTVVEIVTTLTVEINAPESNASANRTPQGRESASPAVSLPSAPEEPTPEVAVAAATSPEPASPSAPATPEQPAPISNAAAAAAPVQGSSLAASTSLVTSTPSPATQAPVPATPAANTSASPVQAAVSPSVAPATPVHAGDNLTAMPPPGSTLGQAAGGPRITTPNGGSDQADVPPARPEPEEPHSSQGPLPALNPAGADPVLDFPVGRFTWPFEQDSGAAAGEDGVVEAGLPWWPAVLLAAGSLAAASLAAQSRDRRRKEDFLSKPQIATR
jgi:hypothetical protein